MNKEKYAKQDEQLYYHIKNLQAGNVESYTEIYNLSCKYFYKIIYDIVGDYHTTEDMLQETFLKIYNNIGSLQSPEAFYVWAGRIATNLCIRYIHKYRKEVLTTASEDGEGNEEFIFDTVAEDNEMFIPESVLDNKEHQRMIGEVIDSLSVEQKLAVQCFYFEEMSVKEIAALMECSEGTIKSRLNYARKSIKDSVLHIEKTQGTKLYSFGALPILLLLYKNMAQAAVPAAATAGVGSALAGNMASGGVVSGATVGAGTGGVTSGVTSGVASGVTGATVGVASSAATAAGISGKLVAIIIAGVLVTGGIVGGAIWAGKEAGNKGNVIASQDKEETNENQTTSTVMENTLGDIIPEGGKYIVAATGEELAEGQRMPEMAEQDDCFYYGDYKYTYNYFNSGWKVELYNIEDYQSRTSFGAILESIAGADVADVSYLFEGCAALKETPYLPSGILYMHRTFQQCTSLEKVTNIPEGVTDISSAFSYCENIKEVPDIPASVMNMDSTFYGCTSLINTPNIPEGVTSLFETFKNCEKLVEAPILHEGIVNLSGTFSRCTSLVVAPELPETVTDLSQTFEWCTSLQQPPVIPDNVVIMTGTFDRCVNLESAPNIPYGVTDMAFTIRGCKLITTAPVIPDTVEYMPALFQDCTGLTGEIIINANPYYYEQCFNGVNLEKQGIELGGSSPILEELEATGINK